jgi:ATP-dependent Clp protease ATP-binding subunit ClpA/protein subunit release factor B
MHQKFRLFVQRHENGTYTVTVPGVKHVTLEDEWDDVFPATSRLAAHGLILDELKEDLRDALRKWLSKADPSLLNQYSNHREGQYLEKVDVELRPQDRHGRKRHDRVKLRFSLMITKEEDGQYRVSVPKLAEPELAFYCYSLEELPETAAREISAYFSGTSLEDLLDYQYGRQEFLDEVDVNFSPLKPQRERKKKTEEDPEYSWALRSSGVNLTARAREGRLMRAFRRDHEVNEILNVLAAERASCILLIGPSGAGKTAVVHETARRIREERCPAALRKRQLWSTSPAQLIAGCSFLGQWEEKLQNLVDEVKRRRHILHIDDVAGLTEAGRHRKGDENMAQFLKPFIADGTLVLIGETTPERYRILESRDPGFVSLFRTLHVDETNEETTLSILGAVSAALESALKVRVEPGANEAALELTRRFQPYRAFPGKAVALIEQVAADAAKTGSDTRPVVTRQYAVSAFARQTGLPEFLLSDHLILDPAAVEHHFSERLIGQPDAVRTVVDLVTVIKAGLNDPNKPLGCFFFVGPTGVGKTEMAKALAEYLFGDRDRIMRFDMSEYAEPFNVAKLIGSPQGDDEGDLTKRIRLQPFSVVLLDEFEKAHPSIPDVMLQVLGEGRLTDAGGRTADFRSAIILMTSNLGASAREQRHPGLRVDEAVTHLDSHFREQVERFFRPEFVNRIDRIVVFRPLDRDAMRRIAAREVGHLLEREGVSRRNLLVEFDEEVLDLLLQTGFSPVYGARPLKREIERRIIVPLARYLVSHRITGSELVQIRREGEEVALFSTSLAAAKATVRRAGIPLAGDGPLGADGAVKMDLRELVEAFAAARLRLQEWTEGEAVKEIDREYRKLLAVTRRRSFVAHGPKAYKIWERIYHLERLVKRVAQLRERAEYLEEFATLSQRERSTAYQTDLARSYTELRRDVDFLEVELLCAHLKETSAALLRLRTVGRTARPLNREPWLMTLVKMYLRWTKRKGYKYQVYVPVPKYVSWLEANGLSPKGHVPGYEPGPPVKPGWAEVKAGSFEALLKRLEEQELSELAISLEGTNVYGFLQGEAGTHKLLLRGEEPDPAAPFQTVAAQVEAVGEDASGLAHLNLEWEEKLKAKAEGKPLKVEEPPEVIRLYQPDGDRYVRDLRTEVRTTLVRDVFEGDLDAFVLAYLRSAEAAEARVEATVA